MEKQYTIKEVAEQIRKTEDTARAYCKNGVIKATKQPDGNWLVSESALQDFITGKPAGASEQVSKQLGDEPEVVEARKQTTIEDELKKQAIAQNEKNKAEIEVQLRQKGYDSIDVGLADVESKRKEAIEILETANRERLSVRAELEAVAKEKQKAINALAVVKERERLVNEKWAEMMVKEENEKAFVGKYEGLKKELQELAKYHNLHIEPCIKSLKVITKTIYSWADLLNNNTGYDWTRLYNFLGDKAKVLDSYVDHVDGTMPKVEMEEKKENKDKENE